MRLKSSLRMSAIDSIVSDPNFIGLCKEFELVTYSNYRYNWSAYYWDAIEERGFSEDNPLLDCIAWMRRHPKLYSKLNRNKDEFKGELL